MWYVAAPAGPNFLPFATALAGLSLMIPGVRVRIFNLIRQRIVVREFRYGTSDRASDTVVDAEYEDLDAPSGPSGWTRH